MATTMRLGLLGEANSLCDDLDAAGIKWKSPPRPKPSAVFAAAADSIVITTGAAAFSALAKALCKWIKARNTRDVMVVIEEGDGFATVHAKDMSEEDVELVLKAALRRRPGYWQA